MMLLPAFVMRMSERGDYIAFVLNEDDIIC